MGRILLAFRAFFSALGGGLTADAFATALQPPSTPEPQKPTPKKTVKPPTARRSEAVSLLAALQREARLVDLVMEPLDEYTDEQIGAAARDVLTDCKKVIDRFFEIGPLVDGEEGDTFETPAKIDPNEFQITGNVSGDPPFKGTLVHKGWKASKCELPKWNGNASAALVVTPSEVELS